MHTNWGMKVHLTVNALEERALLTHHCPWCSTVINWGAKKGCSEHDSPSLDRIHNSKTLRPSNVIIVCQRCNMAKGNDTLENYLKWLRNAKAA